MAPGDHWVIELHKLFDIEDSPSTEARIPILLAGKGIGRKHFRKLITF